MKKSEQVRAAIADAKSKGLTQEDVITAIRQATGFGRRLARAYVLNNWDKVEVTAKPAKAAKKAVAKAAKAAPAVAGLSMSKDAIRKREARARAKAAKAEEALM